MFGRAVSDCGPKSSDAQSVASDRCAFSAALGSVIMSTLLDPPPLRCSELEAFADAGMDVADVSCDWPTTFDAIFVCCSAVVSHGVESDILVCNTCRHVTSVGADAAMSWRTSVAASSCAMRTCVCLLSRAAVFRALYMRLMYMAARARHINMITPMIMALLSGMGMRMMRALLLSATGVTA